MTVEWTKEQIIGIIKEIESRPAIWDSFSPVHRDKDKRRDAYQQVADIAALPYDAVEKKFSNLRTQYCREINKAQTICNYKSKWFAYKYLSFLKKDILARRTRMFLVKNTNDQNNFSPLNFLDENLLLNEEENNISTMNSEDVLSCCDNDNEASSDNNNIIMITSDNVNSSSGMSSPVSLIDYSNNNMNNMNNINMMTSSTQFHDATCFSNNINNNNNNNNNKYCKKRKTTRESSWTTSSCSSDEYEMFGKSIAAQLKNIKDPYAKSLAKLKIQNALFEAETLNITRNNNNNNNNVIKYEPESINNNNSKSSKTLN